GRSQRRRRTNVDRGGAPTTGAAARAYAIPIPVELERSASRPRVALHRRHRLRAAHACGARGRPRRELELSQQRDPALDDCRRRQRDKRQWLTDYAGENSDVRFLRVMTACGIMAGTLRAQSLGVGRPPTPEEIRAIDIEVLPDGRGLPSGRGTAEQG